MNAQSTSRRILLAIPAPRGVRLQADPGLKRVVDDRNEDVRLNQPLSPGRVEVRRRLGRYGVLLRTPFGLQLLHAVTHGDEDVAIARQRGTVAQWSMSRHDARRRVAHLEPLLRRGDHAVDLPARTRIDE